VYEIIIEMTMRLNLTLLQDALKEKCNNHDTNRTFTEDFPTAEPVAPIDPTCDAATTTLEDDGDAIENEIIVSRERETKEEGEKVICSDSLQKMWQV
jgi:hypothetical protein